MNDQVNEEQTMNNQPKRPLNSSVNNKKKPLKNLSSKPARHIMSCPSKRTLKSSEKTVNASPSSATTRSDVYKNMSLAIAASRLIFL